MTNACSVCPEVVCSKARGGPPHRRPRGGARRGATLDAQAAGQAAGQVAGRGGGGAAALAEAGPASSGGVIGALSPMQRRREQKQRETAARGYKERGLSPV